MARRVGEVFSFLKNSSKPRWPRQSTAPKQNASVLLEVVLALALFVFAATVITGGLNASVQEVERLRLNLHASNLAISILSEIQMGIRLVEGAGPEPFDAPFADWTWQIEVSPVADLFGSALPLQSIEVAVRHKTRPIVRRLTQYLPVSSGAELPSPYTDQPSASRDSGPTSPPEF